MDNEIKILGVDIETAPNQVFVWDLWDQNIATNQIIEPGYTLCWAAKWFGSNNEIMFDSIYKSSFKNMLKSIHKLISEADAVVHYNGSRFDMPTLNKEFITNGLLPPSPYANIDLLTTAKRVFKFPSNRLDYVCARLGLGTKIETKGMDLWTGCMDFDKESWELMEAYNKQDIVLLEKLYARLLPWITNHPNVSIHNYDNTALHCSRCNGVSLRKEGQYYTKTGVYQRFQCRNCGKWLRGRTTIRPPERKAPLLVDARVS